MVTISSTYKERDNSQIHGDVQAKQDALTQSQQNKIISQRIKILD